MKRYLFTRGEPLPSYINARLLGLNPKKWPQARRQRSSKEREHIERWAVKCRWQVVPDPLTSKFKIKPLYRNGKPVLVPFWGGRKQSKYNPVVEDAKHAIA